MSISTARIHRECENETFCHEMAFEVCRERDELQAHLAQLRTDLAAARAEVEAMKADRLKLSRAYDPNCEVYSFTEQWNAMRAAAQTVEVMQELAAFLGRDPEGCLVDCADEAMGRIERAEEKADELTSQAAAFAATELVTEECEDARPTRPPTCRNRRCQVSVQPIAIFHYEFPFNEVGEQVWSWRHVECFTIEGDECGALAWHIRQACDPECPTNFRVEWLDANNGRTTEARGEA